jgi:hypothetical protein
LEQFYAYIHLENANQDKYRSILKNLNSQRSLGNNQYPKMIVETTNVLSEHPFDKRTKQDTKTTKSKSKMGQQQTKPNTFVCSVAQKMLLLWQARLQVAQLQQKG